MGRGGGGSGAPHGSTAAGTAGAADTGVARIVCVGDIHDAWTETDARLLHNALRPDVVLFVGDFGNENVPLVQSIAAYADRAMQSPRAAGGADDARAADPRSPDACRAPRAADVAAICGNHDAWFSATQRGLQQCPYDREREDRIAEQLEALYGVDVGYTHRRVLDNSADVAVVGGRPFSWGGSRWRCPGFFDKYYGVSSMEQSAERIAREARAAGAGNVVFLAHNGPRGLGDEVDSVCGRDFGLGEAHPASSHASRLASSASSPTGARAAQPEQTEDYGCPDLERAIDDTKASGMHVPLCVFGHMHETLKCDRDRCRHMVAERDGTVYVNAAVVPRIRRVPDAPLRWTDTESAGDGRDGAASSGEWTRETLHNFTVVDVRTSGDGTATADPNVHAVRVLRVRQLWLSSYGTVASERTLYARDIGGSGAEAARAAVPSAAADASAP